MNLVASWRCTNATLLSEPVLTLKTLDGRELTFMLPAMAAKQMGEALIAHSERSAPVGPAH